MTTVAGGCSQRKKEKKGTRRLGNYSNKYTEETFLEALQAMKENRMSLREAARQYGGPQNHVD